MSRCCQWLIAAAWITSMQTSAHAQPRKSDDNSSGGILVAIDGTSSAEFLEGTAKACWPPPQPNKTNTGIWRSAVRNFEASYRSPGKLYLAGPKTALPGRYVDAECEDIFQQAYNHIETEWLKNPSLPIDLVGHSRGGFIVMELAKKLNTDGFTVKGKKTAPIPVRFVGLYDAVSSTGNWGSTRTISANVRHALAIQPAPATREDAGKYTQSRWIFTRPLEGPADRKATNFRKILVKATHSAIGGAPWDADRPAGHSKENDVNLAMEVDRTMRMAAAAAGVPIGEIEDYGDLSPIEKPFRP